MKKVDVRTAVALDVVKTIKDDVRTCEYSKKFPVIFTIITKENKTCDIAVIRNIEQETVFKNLNDYSKLDKIIIVLETNKYNKNIINTSKEVLICTYPIKIIDKVN